MAERASRRASVSVTKRAAALVPAVLLAAGLTACASSGASGGGAGSGSGPILIGEIAGTTGAYGTTGQAMVNGAKMAVAYLNAHGGIMGRKVTLQYYNDQASATLASQEFDRLVSAGAVAITGSGDTGPAVAAEADRRQVVAFGDVDDGGLTVYPNGPNTTPLPWVFDLGLNTFAWGSKIGQYALSHCTSGLAVLHDPTTYGEGGEAGIKSVYSAAGKKLSLDDAITEDWSSGATVSLTSEINQIKATGADCVDVWLTPQDQAAFVTAAHNQGAHFTILGNDETDSDATYSNLAKNLANGTVSALLATELHPSAALSAFESQYQSEFHVAATPFATTTYDGIMMLKQAIDTAKSTSAKSIQTALNNLSGYHGLTGTLSFSPSEHTTINADQLTLVQYDAASGNWVPVS